MPIKEVDAGRKRVRALRMGLEERMGVLERKQDAAGVEPWRLSIPETARELLRLAGVPSARGYSPSEALTECLKPSFSTRAAANASADLPSLLANAQNKALMKAYKAAQPTWRSWCRIGNLSDFKVASRVQLSDAAQLRETGENGEILDSKISDRAESYQLGLYARKVSFTLQMMINDDLQSLRSQSERMGRSAAQLPSRLVYIHLLSNPTMSDGNALFEATYHKNLRTGGGSALADTALATALSDFRKQTAPQAPNDTEFAAEPIDLEPRVMLVPPELEYTANQLVNPNMYVAGSPYLQNRFKIEVESRLSNSGFTGYSTTRWFLAASGEEADTVEVGFLNGDENPVTSEWSDFDTLSVKFRAWLACGVKAMDWRGLQRNDGA